MITAADLVRSIAKIVSKQKDLASPGRATIPASYVSGNPTMQLPGETPTTLGSKTQKIVQPYGFNGSAPAASDNIAYLRDSLGNRVIIGKIVDLSQALIDGISWNGARWVQPGNTVLLSANTERSTTSTSFVTLKEFIVDRPGRYRITFDSATDSSGGGAASYQILATFEGLDFVASSTVASTSQHPTYVNKTLDMTLTVPQGARIKVQVKDTSGANAAYIQNCVLKYADATAALASAAAVVTD